MLLAGAHRVSQRVPHALFCLWYQRTLLCRTPVCMSIHTYTLRRHGLASRRTPASDCWPSRRCVWPFSCWIILPGSKPVSRICTQRPTPYFIRQSFRMLASSFVQPGEGVKFHLPKDWWSVVGSHQPDLQVVSAEQASKEGT